MGVFHGYMRNFYRNFVVFYFYSKTPKTTAAWPSELLDASQG
jgi:hypothetical protein